MVIDFDRKYWQIGTRGEISQTSRNKSKLCYLQNSAKLKKKNSNPWRPPPHILLLATKAVAALVQGRLVGRKNAIQSNIISYYAWRTITFVSSIYSPWLDINTEPKILQAPFTLWITICTKCWSSIMVVSGFIFLIISSRGGWGCKTTTSNFFVVRIILGPTHPSFNIFGCPSCPNLSEWNFITTRRGPAHHGWQFHWSWIAMQ